MTKIEHIIHKRKELLHENGMWFSVIAVTLIVLLVRLMLDVI